MHTGLIFLNILNFLTVPVIILIIITVILLFGIVIQLKIIKGLKCFADKLFLEKCSRDAEIKCKNIEISRKNNRIEQLEDYINHICKPKGQQQQPS